MKQRKILIATDCFLPRLDGIARFLDLLIPELSKKYEITVIAPRFTGKKPEYQGVKIIKFPLSLHRFGKLGLADVNVKKLKEEIKKTDIVFVQMIGPIGIYATYNAKKYNKTIVNYLHTIEWYLAPKMVRYFRGIIKVMMKKITRYCYNKSTLLLAPSKEVKNIFLKHKIKTPIKILPLGIQTNKFVPPLNKKNAKIQIGIPPDYNVIGFIGRIGTLEKDVPTLITAFMKIKKKHPKTKLLLVGKKISNGFPKNKDIIYAGVKNNVIPYLQTMDVFVMPSLIETNSLATMEAMSTGCAVIATRVGSIKEYLVNKTNGLFFPKKDIFILTTKINYLLENEAIRRRLGQNSRQTILEKYKWEDTVKKMIDVFDKIEIN